MADAERRKRGADMIKKVYAGDVPVPEAGVNAFIDVMLETLFADVWTRGELSMRDRRLLLLGVIATMGEGMTFGIQVKAALKNGELTPAQVREALIQLAPYTGYPRTAGIIAPAEQAIAEFEKSQKKG